MSELPGTAAVGIESVEWTDAGAGNLTVSITGRWRRRRPASGAPAMLVLDADGQRHRYPAMPEPPSLGSTPAGMWRLSFSVPARFAPDLGGRAWLALGSVTVPLPGSSAAAAEPETVAEPRSGEAAPRADGRAPGTPAGEPPGDAPPVDAPAAPEEPSAGLEIERAWRRAELAERERRAAEQRAHAEEALRRELAERLGDEAREAARAREALGELAAAEERIRELEDGLARARRAEDEAGRAAAAALAARHRAERALAGRAADAGGPEARWLSLEDSLRARRRDTQARVPAEPGGAGARSVAPPIGAPAMAASAVAASAPAGPAPAAPAGPVALEPLPASLGEPELVGALRRELRARAEATAGLRARAVQAETRLAARTLLEQRAAATVRELRSELDGLRESLTGERERRVAAERIAAQLRGELTGQRERSRDAQAAITALRGSLDELVPPGAAGPPGAGAPAAAAGGAVTPEALSDALTRLRSQSEPRAGGAPEAAAAGAMAPAADSTPGGSPAALALTRPGTPTVESAFRRLLRRDAELAGRVVLDLLGAQRTVHPAPLSYDVVLGPGHGCAQVTIPSAGPVVAISGVARSREQVDFQLLGDPARLARLLGARPLRRALRIGLARVRGRREGVSAVRALLGLGLELAGLRAAGMRTDPETLLALVAAMIEPAWTRGEAFTIAHADPSGTVTYLHVADGAAARVSRVAPPGRVAAELRGSADALAVALGAGRAGDPPAASIHGDAGPVALVREWIKRAQCG